MGNKVEIALRLIGQAGVVAGLDQIQRKMTSAGAAIKEIALAAVGVAGVAGIGGAFTSAVVGGIKFNAMLEQQTIAFKTLLGSMGAAQERMAALNRFAAETPFELPEVVNASRILQTLTAGALASEEGLRLVGDAAAASGRAFEETAMWVGRLTRSRAGLRG